MNYDFKKFGKLKRNKNKNTYLFPLLGDSLIFPKFSNIGLYYQISLNFYQLDSRLHLTKDQNFDQNMKQLLRCCLRPIHIKNRFN